MEHSEADFTHGICPECLKKIEIEMERWPTVRSLGPCQQRRKPPASLETKHPLIAQATGQTAKGRINKHESVTHRLKINFETRPTQSSLFCSEPGQANFLILNQIRPSKRCFLGVDRSRGLKIRGKG